MLRSFRRCYGSYKSLNIPKSIKDPFSDLLAMLPPAVGLKVVKASKLGLVTDRNSINFNCNEVNEVTTCLIDVVAQYSFKEIGCLAPIMEKLYEEEINRVKRLDGQCPTDLEMRIKRLTSLMTFFGHRNSQFPVFAESFVSWSKGIKAPALTRHIIQALVDKKDWVRLNGTLKQLSTDSPILLLKDPLLDMLRFPKDKDEDSHSVGDNVNDKRMTSYYAQSMLQGKEENKRDIPASFHRSMVRGLLLEQATGEADLKSLISHLLSNCQKEHYDLLLEEIVFSCICIDEIEAAKYIVTSWFKGLISDSPPCMLVIALFFDRLHEASHSSQVALEFYSWLVSFLLEHQEENHAEIFLEPSKIKMEFMNIGFLISSLDLGKNHFYDNLICSLDFDETNRVLSLIERHPKLLECPGIIKALAKKTLFEMNNYVLFERVRRLVSQKTILVSEYCKFIEYALNTSNHDLAVRLYIDWKRMRAQVNRHANGTSNSIQIAQLQLILPRMLDISLKDWNLHLASMILQDYTDNGALEITKNVTESLHAFSNMLIGVASGGSPLYNQFSPRLNVYRFMFLESLIKLSLSRKDHPLGSLAFETSRFSKQKLPIPMILSFIKMIYDLRGTLLAMETYKLYVNHEMELLKGFSEGNVFFRGLLKLCYEKGDFEFGLSILQDMQDSFEDVFSMESFHLTILISTIAKSIEERQFILKGISIDSLVNRAEALWDQAKRMDLINGFTVSAMLDVYHIAAVRSTLEEKNENEFFTSSALKTSSLDNAFIKKALSIWDTVSTESPSNINPQSCNSYWKILRLCKQEEKAQELFKNSVALLDSTAQDKELWNSIKKQASILNQ